MALTLDDFVILSLERWGIIAHAGVGDIGEVRSLHNGAGFGVNRDQIVGIGKTGNDLSIYNEQDDRIQKPPLSVIQFAVPVAGSSE